MVQKPLGPTYLVKYDVQRLMDVSIMTAKSRQSCGKEATAEGYTSHLLRISRLAFLRKDYAEERELTHAASSISR